MTAARLVDLIEDLPATVHEVGECLSRHLLVCEEAEDAQVVRANPQRVYRIIGRPPAVVELIVQISEVGRNLVFEDRRHRPVAEELYEARGDCIRADRAANGIVEALDARFLYDEPRP